MAMRAKGITYDTGFLSAGTSTHEPFEPEVVRREMRCIHDDLHCNAIRITGGYPDRLQIAARYAAEAGLEVWFCPFTNGLTASELLDLLGDCAERAEGIRKQGAEMVLLTGSEVGLFTRGFLPGDRLEDRLALLTQPEKIRALIPGMRNSIKEFLGNAVGVVRERFGGRVSYASIPFEAVDWGPFDIIATDAGYRTAQNEARFRDDIRAFVAQGKALGKPVAITEFGCGTYLGASNYVDKLDIVEWDDQARPVRFKREFARNEGEQARYVSELLDVFESEGVDDVFVYTFARYDLPHREAAHEDFDMASYGVVKVLNGQSGKRYPGMPWEPKEAFDALAKWYARERV